MTTNAEIDTDIHELLTAIAELRLRIAARPEHGEATSIGFLDVGLEAAQNAIRGGYQCMQSESHAPGVPLDLDIEYAMSPIVGFV